MKTPIPLGNLTPHPGEEWNQEAVRASVDTLDESLRKQVADYLDNCPPIMLWMGVTRDVIGDRFATGTAILSDGEFYWREDAGSYVRHYGVAIPQGALEYMKRRNWSPPQFTKSERDEIERVLVSCVVS